MYGRSVDLAVLVPCMSMWSAGNGHAIMCIELRDAYMRFQRSILSNLVKDAACNHRTCVIGSVTCMAGHRSVCVNVLVYRYGLVDQHMPVYRIIDMHML